ncbi:hypothetical protein KFK09_002145 [Dendrobium nobile]|uniref:Uncharacterized protein n=1 Tax=Dendrobium nobile TaxID=94219 RepID=A0A8T3CC62_DENNO|nr:hypothetical protein KFK09_002145 [Dendrobium nobile]
MRHKFLRIFLSESKLILCVGALKGSESVEIESGTSKTCPGTPKMSNSDLSGRKMDSGQAGQPNRSDRPPPRPAVAGPAAARDELRLRFREPELGLARAGLASRAR